VILHSGTTSHKRISLKTFAYTWARSNYWGVLVLPSSLLPAVAPEENYLRAVGHLERLGHWDTAAGGYQSALRRWPESLAATIGLGVCRYGQGDLKTAETIFRHATLKFPDEGILFNNLAQVLMDQGRKSEALDAVVRAIQIGGPLKAHFENTFEEIRKH
jgi:tetratricopeptide (TPR) repeat protein